jgi:Holliday junction resolvase RusA-like endonuclease
MARFFVDGVPQPQGSKTCFCTGGRAVVVEGRRGPARKAFKAWRAAVKAEASQHDPVVGAVRVFLGFRFARPPSHLKKRGGLRKGAPLFPQSRPDLDKLQRAVLDGLTDGGLIEDDSRVVFITARKEYLQLGTRTGVYVMVDALGVCGSCGADDSSGLCSSCSQNLVTNGAPGAK